MIISKQTALEKIKTLIERFEEQYPSYKKAEYNETLARKDFIDPFFSALGWDMDNSSGYAEAYREVIHEDKIRISGAMKAPDYSFRLPGGKRLFFVEAKKPSVLVKEEIQPAYQLRRYGWSAKLPISIITDFEEFAVYDCSKKPFTTDKASTARLKYLSYKEYIAEFDFLWNTFSKEKVLKGSFDKFVQSDTYKKGTTTVDKEFLASLDVWRKELAMNIALRNEKLNEDELNFVVQQTIDRIIFLRIAEDRNVEGYGRLKDLVKTGDYYENLFQYFREADEKYNSGLFDFRKDTISKKITVDNKVIKNIISELYYPLSPYEFSVLSVEILGSAYEQFLGKQIKLTAGHRAHIEDKPEVRKAGGVYYTPQYIVDYIVKQTVGKLVEGKTPKEVSRLKIVDPACGSGSFLIGAYDYLLKWHKDFYNNSGKLPKKDSPLTPDGNLTTAEKKRILLNNIHGVDIDVNACEVTKLSLLLKCMEGETNASIQTQLKLFNERVLPTLDNNIKCGNSLIDTDFYDGQIDFEDDEEKKIKPFNWQTAFPEVFKQSGFDVVIGNPPYIPIEFFKDQEKEYYKNKFKEVTRKYDTSVLFILRGINLLSKSGLLGFISTQTWQTGENFAGFRKKIFENFGLKEIINLPFDVFKDAYVDTGIFIFSKKNNPTYKFHAFKKRDKIRTIEDVPFSEIAVNSLSTSNYKVIFNETINEISSRFSGKTFLPLGSITISTQGLSASRFKRTSKTTGEFILPFINAIVKRYFFKQDEKYFIDLGSQKSLLQFYNKNEKILIRRIINRQDRIDATYFSKEAVFKKDLNPFILTQSNLSTKYILGLLNSKLFSWLYLNTSSIATKDDFRQTTLAELRQLPIKNVDYKSKSEKSIHDEIVKFVDEMLELNQQKQKATLPNQIEMLQQRIDHTDKKIDQLVYKLYGLTDEEIKIVEAT